MVNDGRTRYADDLTLQELVRLRVENEQYWEALKKIGYGPPNEGEPLDLLNQFVDLARAALKGDE